MIKYVIITQRKKCFVYYKISIMLKAEMCLEERWIIELKYLVENLII